MTSLVGVGAGFRIQRLDTGYKRGRNPMAFIRRQRPTALTHG